MTHLQMEESQILLSNIYSKFILRDYEKISETTPCFELHGVWEIGAIPSEGYSPLRDYCSQCKLYYMCFNAL